MARYTVTVDGKGLTIASLNKAIQQALKGKKGITASAQKTRIPKSRADRLAVIQALVGEAISDAESLRDEMQEWHDSIPENLQSGSKADEVQEAIDALESLVSSLEDASNSEVNFPGMF